MATTYTLPDPDNRVFLAGQSFEFNGVLYPPDWLIKATEDDLDALGISVADVPDPGPTEQQLKTYAAFKERQMSDSGLVVDIGDGETVLVNVTTTIEGRTDIIGLRQLFDLGAETVPWIQAAGNINITAAQLAIIGTAVAELRAAAVAKGTLAWVGIENETITTFEQIDTIFAS